MDEKIEKIEELGYNSFFEANRVKLGLEDFVIARVTAGHKGAYKVRSADGEYLAKITGKQIWKASSSEDYPAVGDWVAIWKLEEGSATIHTILPRKTVIKRKQGGKNEIQMIATNIDVAFAVESVGRDFNLNRLERYFAIANDGGTTTAIILNKIDLISKEELDLKIAQIKKRFKSADVILISTLTKEGMEELEKYIKKGLTYCFLGSSGVGKSSIINGLIGRDKIKTGDIGGHSGRGKHTTTAREMYFLPQGGIVVDNPGMREVGMANATLGIDNFFDEIDSLAGKCKFLDCTHVHEPECEVLNALKAGKLDKDKYENYINLKKEAQFFQMTKLEKKGKDQQFGKFMKKAKRDLKNYQHKSYID
jgi:ribosome biogenesis GTPase